MLKKAKARNLLGDPMGLDNQLCFAVYTASRLLIQTYEPILKRFDLTYTQYIVMLALDPKTNPSVKEIGKDLFLDSGTLSPLLKKMEKKDLLQRLHDLEDERSVRVVLTAKGKKLRADLACVGKQVSEAVQGVNVDELIRTKGTLQLLAKALSTS